MHVYDRPDSTALYITVHVKYRYYHPGHQQRDLSQGGEEVEVDPTSTTPNHQHLHILYVCVCECVSLRERHTHSHTTKGQPAYHTSAMQCIFGKRER